MIKQTEQGIWVIEGDTHISKWVIENKRLDHDQWLLPILYRYVRPGDVVVDIGANIGDHTIAYSDWVGSKGMVIAFECGKLALQCLEKNLESRLNVQIAPVAVYRDSGYLNFIDDKNAGASHVALCFDPPTKDSIKCVSLDNYFRPTDRIDFMKIDAEGSEVEILRGGYHFFTKIHPLLCLEVNRYTLKRAGTSEDELLQLLDDYGYRWEKLQPEESGQYDIIARFVGRPPELL